MPWTNEQPLADPRWGLAAATSDAPAPASGSRIYAIGGVDVSSARLATAAAYDTSAHNWSPIAPMPTARQMLAATSGPGRVHALGGVGAGGVLAAHEIYDPAKDAWSAAQSMPTARRGLAAVTGPDGLVYALGGHPVGTGAQLATVEAYDPTKAAWTRKASMPTPRGGLAAVTGHDGLIYAIGGRNPGGPLSTVEAYDPVADKWTAKDSLPAARQVLAAAVDPNGLIYAIGGSDASDDPQPTVYSYDPAHPAAGWAVQAPLPTARSFLAAATGPDGLIYAIGGYAIVGATQSTALGTVEAYTAPVPPPPVNRCLELVASLEQRLADGGPRVPVAEGKAITTELANCHQQGALNQAQYERALATLNAINKFSQTPPRP